MRSGFSGLGQCVRPSKDGDITVSMQLSVVAALHCAFHGLWAGLHAWIEVFHTFDWTVGVDKTLCFFTFY